ncbi:NACHT domain-containing protein [Lentzea sp. BCCO 10_0061]|uniref:NACHT domain-containing protein n=1 Tax=Lentzea sokolovensis TaxID=3095429 RepID=A0ABU4UNH1_9PSEU|nr:NACHT domain-containing protein [Lentzea sp. BCCO 10_0061]MDX8140964.1 NACHT domain-containing protein [Lentzea sp. BCCO 10_0061]
MTSERASDPTNVARVGDATNVVQVGAVHGDLNVGTATRRPAPVEIASLMRAQVLMAEQLPYQLRGARTPSLSTVYVRQDLGTGGDELTSGESRPRPMVDGHGQLVDVSTTPRVRTSVRPPARTVREALESDDHLVITGGPGQGKSTLTLRLAAELALGWSADGTEQTTERVVPLRLPARELAARLDVPFAEALAASVRAEYNLRLRCAIDPSHFEDRVSGCRWLLLVDGLDEVTSPAARDDLVHALAGWAASGDVYRIVLTTRPIEGGVLAPLQRIGATRYELQPFDEEALRTFAESWFRDDGDAATNFLRQIRKAYLDELVRVPLLATIAAIIFEQRRAHPLPDNQYELYEAYLKYLRSGHPHHPSPLDAHREPLLEHLGQVRVDADTSLLAAARTWAATHVAGEWQDDLVRFLTAVGPFTLRADDIHFLHHSFADHLAATAKARGLPATFTADHFAYLLHAARPREHGRHARRVLLHYGRLRPLQADSLLRTLNSGDSEKHLLAARLLAGHLPASSGVVEAFLTTTRAWAMTTHHYAYEILAGASRATHHPGLADWLADLMSDPRAPWTSRAEAAAALATRLRGHTEQAALELLHTAVNDVEGQIVHRLVAAEALSECGDNQRATAEQALRVILDDPFATPREHRDAALVMASLGGEARAFATVALLSVLNDPEAPPPRMAEAANGLVEITVEHADRCAEVLVEILRNCPAWLETETLRTAAKTLGSLGAQYVASGVETINNRVADARLVRWERVAAAGVLVTIGPSYRAAAARHIVALSEQPGVPLSELWRHGEALLECGWEYRKEVASIFHRVLNHGALTVNTAFWAIRGLLEIGPEYRGEAVSRLTNLCEATAHRFSTSWEHEAALSEVASADESRRTEAVSQLRATLADRTVAPVRRNQAASRLIRLGPEFHAEVIDHLRELAERRSDLGAGLVARHRLSELGAQYRTEAAAFQIELISTGDGDDHEPADGLWLSAASFDDVDAVGAVWLRLLQDHGRDEHWRGFAARNLIELGQAFHRRAVRGLIDLIRTEAVPRTYLAEWLQQCAGVADVFQKDLAQALLAQVLSADSTAATVVNAAEAMRVMGWRRESEVVPVLSAILHGADVNPWHRLRLAVQIASLQPDLADAVTRIVVSDQRDARYGWNEELWSLSQLGAEPLPLLCALVADANARAVKRVHGISALVSLGRYEAPEILGRFANDEYLHHRVRANAAKALAEQGGRELPQVREHHKRVRDDLTAPIADRCTSAHCLSEMDMTAASAALDLLPQFAVDAELTVAERALAVSSLQHLIRVSALTDFLGRAVADDPASGAAERKRALRGRKRVNRLAAQRVMLADRSIDLEHRIPDLDNWSYQPLRRETEVAVRDVLAAPESSHHERVTAAAALAQLSSCFVAEAAELLDCMGWRGQDELAKLGPRWSAQVRANARTIADDETQPWRERWKASRFDWSVEPRSHEQHMERAEARGAIAQLRTMLTDPRPATRWRAAKRLRDYDFADRVAGAQALEAIAEDPTNKAALRWRAGEELTRFGAKGRERGVRALRHMMGDEWLNSMARVEAATVVGKIRPDLRAEVVRFLRRMKVDEPLLRIRLYKAIGVFEPDEGAQALQDMTKSKVPVVRIKAAEAMFALRRDYKEQAAMTARDVMRDRATPWHVRRRAAVHLARWSDLMVEEARAVLRACRRP